MSDLRNKVVLITGASSGIGAGTALHLAKLGAKLGLVARNQARLEEVAKECTEAGSPQVYISVHDLSVEAECVLAVQETVKHFGALNVLINNAGVLHRSDFNHVTVCEINESYNIHVNAAVRISQTSMPALIESGGTIVNVSSIAGLRPYPGALAYKLSKAALDQFTRCLALEVAKQGVRVNSVNPGVIKTDIFTSAGMSNGEVEEYYIAGERLHPLGRVGKVQEVAKAIAFLASEDSSFITGQTLAVDGGRSLSIPYQQY